MPKKYRWILIVIVILLALANYFGLGKKEGLHQVLAVADGDTILVDFYGQTETIRLIGVDTPETHHPSKPVQCYGPEASDYTTNRLAGEYVRLEADMFSDNRDRYDRLLRFVYTESGELFNKTLVEQGYGFAITAFNHSMMQDFVESQEDAKAQQNGLWSACQVDESGKYPSTTSPSTSS